MTKKISMKVINSKAAGIDIGSRSHFVSVGQEPSQVKEFGVYTDDHNNMIRWLTDFKVTSIAMESTGSYWQTLFTALQTAGFEVILVNGRDIKNVKGKKTDVLDCQWIQQLHSLGLLRSSFLPDEATRQLRSYYHYRQNLITQCAKYNNKMQKSLRLMNIRLDVAIRDITGKTGMNIISAIINGERDPHKLASLADVRVKKSHQEIALSLEGEWKEDLIFILQDCHSMYEYYREKIIACDQQIETLLNKYIDQKSPPLEPLKKIRKKNSKNSVSFDLRPYAYRILEVDLYEIENISHTTVLSILSTLGGKGIHKFPSVKHFVSWLRLAPNNKISGGKVISSRTPKGKNKVSIALRQVANTIGNSKTHPLKNFFARIAFKKGRGAAITATARKLAVIIYNMVTKKISYNPIMLDVQEENRKQRRLNQIRKSLINLSEAELEVVFS